MRIIACRLLIVWLLASAGSACTAWGQESAESPVPPQIAPASPEAEQAMARFRHPDGWEVKLFAAEPRVANPVSFHVDARGRVFVCESFRQNQGVTDNRGHDQRWLDADLAAQTVADRIRYHRELLGPKVAEYTRQDDRIRMLEDRDGDGVADHDSVFADHFHRLEEGTGAGVLAYRDDVFFTCIPRLWRMRDQDGDGRADLREVLHDGYGVRVAFRGHDLHGLTIGPDGRLYFSIGDRGYHIELGDRTLADPESGAVFRCELDGSGLEVIATGLRNPQELAFDELGNLFTGDNNSDSGDKARWVYVAEGGDTGWRMSYQYLPDRGPFNREKIWHPQHEGQPAYIVPPIANFADGPSGLAYYPGTGLGDEFTGCFFLCDFRGTPANSGVRTIKVEPRGAFFSVVQDAQPIWSILATDVAFGPQGIYVSDWVDGWNGEGKGRIYCFRPAGYATDAKAQEVHQLLAQGLDGRPAAELTQLLNHADQRIRQEAQFALVRAGDIAALQTVVRDTSLGRLARLHALWGLGQHARQKGGATALADTFVSLLSDGDDEVRGQSARLCGELGLEAVLELRRLLRDAAPRVRYFAALAVGRLAARDALPEIVRLLSENADQDPILRHGGIMALAGMNDVPALTSLAREPSRSVRLAAVVALRKLRAPAIATFLNDADTQVMLEAARAIHDVPIPEAMPELARRLEGAPLEDALLRRTLNANFRLGTPDHAQAVAAFAARAEAPPAMRLEAVRMLGQWAEPSARDRVLGMWRPCGPRPADAARLALQPVLASLLAHADDELRGETLNIAARLGVGEAAPILKSLLSDSAKSGTLRASALQALAALGDSQVKSLARELLNDALPEVRLAACRVLAKDHPEEALRQLSQATGSPSVRERQGAYAILGEMDHDPARKLLAEAMQALLERRVPDDTQLDVLEAARTHASSETLAELVSRYEQGLDPQEPVSLYGSSMAGGDPDRGRRIFFERTDVSCVRCHKVSGVGGEVGPELTQIAKEKDRKYLLESIVEPNRAVAEKFRSVIIVDADGRVHTGIVKRENDDEVELLTAEGKSDVIAKEDIDVRADGKSSMPQDLIKHLSRRDVRDLVAWLGTLK